MKKLVAIIAMLVLPGVSMAAGLIGDCYDCHTMHNSESGASVAQVVTNGVKSTSVDPIANLLKLDCVACHAMNPNGADKVVTLTGGSKVPQVAHADTTGDLAGGNFSYGMAGGNDSMSKVHNVSELFAAGIEHNAVNGVQPGFGTGPGGSAKFTGAHDGKFTDTLDYDLFGCAGARGCHGTRNQDLVYDSLNSSNSVMRTGMAAISGSHHNSYDGVKDVNATNYIVDEGHKGKKLANSYRFIPGLKGAGNTVNRWENNAADHNEYYGSTAGLPHSCGTCHIGGTSSSDVTTLAVPNNSMSGFCSTCHGLFHSSGVGNDYVDNGVSGAFLRHPSDYTLPGAGTEYANYTAYDISAPVARPTVYASSNVVTPGTDMVMCLSCHIAHGSEYDYILRFDYKNMYAGGAGLTVAASQAIGGCLACHSEKGADIDPATGLKLQ